MKMIRRPKSRNKVWIYSWITVGVLVLAAAIYFTGPLIALPFIKFGSFMQGASSAAVGFVNWKNSTQTENLKLKDQLAQMQAVIDRDKLLVQENLDLKELLGRHSKNSSVLVSVLSKPPMSLYDTLIVDAGIDQGISMGDKVVAAGLVPVGTVVSVFPHSSTVQLYSSAGQKMDVLIKKNIQTTAESLGGGNFIIKLPKGTEVEEGDPISAPGLDVSVFGHVQNIESTENEPFVYVRFNLPVNVAELHFLQIDRVPTS